MYSDFIERMSQQIVNLKKPNRQFTKSKGLDSHRRNHSIVLRSNPISMQGSNHVPSNAKAVY